LGLSYFYWRQILELTLLGTGTAVPSLNRSSSAYLIQSSGQNIIIDFGSGTMRRLLEVKLTYNDVDMILITHLHPDHTSDLVPLFFANRYHKNPRMRNLPIVGRKGLASFLDNLDHTFEGALLSKLYDITIKEVDDERWMWKGITFFSKPLKHSKRSVGYVIEDKNKRIAFSGDTGYCNEIVELASNADYFVCECSFPDAMMVDGHLTPTLAARIAKEGGIKKLILTHFYPEVENERIIDIIRSDFSGEVILGSDLHRIKL
jgi:ribonuclease BN (tRNA processing enzyme)